MNPLEPVLGTDRVGGIQLRHPTIASPLTDYPTKPSLVPSLCQMFLSLICYQGVQLVHVMVQLIRLLDRDPPCFVLFKTPRLN